MDETIAVSLTEEQRTLLLENVKLQPELKRLISVTVKRNDRFEIVLTPPQIDELCEEISQQAEKVRDEHLYNDLFDLCDYFDDFLAGFGFDYADEPPVTNYGTNTGKVFVFKVALEGGAQAPWRRIAMRGGQTLHDLHEAIFRAFDREEQHLYSFYLSNTTTKQVRKRWEGPEYTHPFNLEEPAGLSGLMSGFMDREMNDAAQTKIASLKLKPRQKITYLFDFGDEWWHDIEVEQINLPADKETYPRVLERKGQSPPQYPDFDDDDDDFLDDEEDQDWEQN